MGSVSPDPDSLCPSVAHQQLVGALKHTPAPSSARSCLAIEAAAEQRKGVADLSAGAMSELGAH